jgi:hypothetical protein
MLAGCSGSSPSPEATSSAGSTLSGPIALHAIGDPDVIAIVPPISTVTSIVVTITRIDARIESSSSQSEEGDDTWTALSTTPTTLDILAVPKGGYSTLLVAKLPASGLERLRLTVSSTGPNYVMTSDGVRHDLVVPSDTVDVVGVFDVDRCSGGYVTLAFGGRRALSVHAAGASGEWILRPIVRVSQISLNGVACDDDDGHESR